MIVEQSLPGCPRGIEDDLTGRLCGTADANAPVADQNWPDCPRGIDDDVTGHRCVTESVDAPIATESVAPKGAGHAAQAQAVAPEQDRHASAPGFFYVVGSGDQRDCFLESDWTVSAPRKPAELAQSGCCGEPPGAWEEVQPKPAELAQSGCCGEPPGAWEEVPPESAELAQSGCCGEPPGAWEEVQPKPAELAQSGWTGCPWGYGFNPMIHGDVLECLDRPAPATQTASKPAGLAAPAPAPVQFGPCGSSGESPDPLTLACPR